MNVVLREPLIDDYEELSIYINELKDRTDSEGTNGLYKAINENTYPKWLEWIKQNNSRTFLIINEEQIIVGVINIRYSLNDYLKRGGGHIGYNIRPSERRKGYASKALKLILKNAYENGLEEVLIDCYKGNKGSEKTIESSGAILYSEEYSEERNNTLMRYKLNLKEKYKMNTGSENMNIEIRRAKPEDASEIAKVAAYSWLDSYKGLINQDYLNDKITKERLEYSTNKTRTLVESTDKYFVATVDDKVVGFVYYEKSSEEKYKEYGYLEAIYLSEEYKGLGIGKMLFSVAVNGLKNMGYNKFYLHCLTGNKTLGFYEKYTGEVIDTIKYPLRDFDVDADVVLFNDIDEIISMLNSKTNNRKI